MNLIALDLELNQVNDSPKIIEVGAIAFKSHTGEVLGIFQTFVNPKEPILKRITELTGITDDKVIGAPTVLEAYEFLKAFHKKHRCFSNPVLWGSGISNDSLALWRETGVQEENFMGFRVIDAKTLYQSLRIYQNGKVKAGLKTACESLGIGWDSFHGEAHGALSDAYNTYRLWFYMAGQIAASFKKLNQNK